MLRVFAILFGVVFILAGIMGFLPYFLEQGLLFGVLKVNFEHNILNLAAGTLAVLAGLSGATAAQAYFIFAGLAYGALAIFGFMEKGDMLFQMIAINEADNIFHAAMAILFLFFGLKIWK